LANLSIGLAIVLSLSFACFVSGWFTPQSSTAAQHDEASSPKHQMPVEGVHLTRG
jgi:hypothetical protein